MRVDYEVSCLPRQFRRAPRPSLVLPRTALRRVAVIPSIPSHRAYWAGSFFSEYTVFGGSGGSPRRAWMMGISSTALTAGAVKYGCPRAQQAVDAIVPSYCHVGVSQSGRRRVTSACAPVVTPSRKRNRQTDCRYTTQRIGVL